jgi:hypothetical protein
MMFPHAEFFRTPLGIASAVGMALLLLVPIAWFFWSRRLTPSQREARRRNRLAKVGRIIDGTLIDSAPENEPPTALIYRYRIAGVTYECGQDISALAGQIPDLIEATAVFGMPVQVRYDQDNPSDSIVVAENWNGLWNQTLLPNEHVS